MYKNTEFSENDKIRAVLNWSKRLNHKEGEIKFDTKFVESIANWGKLTYKQREALDKIIIKWHIDVEKYTALDSVL